MPLRCVDEHGRTIEAPDCSEEEWESLRERARKERNLHMPCCPARAVLKTSKLGTRFFAHKARGACNWKPETAVHLHLKALALRAARQAGWEAQTEVTGHTPEGEKWTADVFAWKGDVKVAVEVQWSGQTDEETWHRQRRYKRSGIRGIWLLRQPGFPVAKEFPGACIGGSMEEGLRILIPKHQGGTAQDRKKAYHWTQDLEPEEFMKAVFEQRFLFGIEHARTVAFEIRTGATECWRCNALTRIVTYLEGRAGPHEMTMRLHGGCSIELVELVKKAVDERRDIGTIKDRFSRTMGHSYLSNGCAECDALIGQHFEYGAWYAQEETVGQVELELDQVARREGFYETNRWGVWSQAEIEGVAEEKTEERPDEVWKTIVVDGVGRVAVKTEPIHTLVRPERYPSEELTLADYERSESDAQDGPDKPGYRVTNDFPVPRQPAPADDPDQPAERKESARTGREQGAEPPGFRVLQDFLPPEQPQGLAGPGEGSDRPSTAWDEDRSKESK